MRLSVARHAGGPRVRTDAAPTSAQNRTNAAWLRDQLEALTNRIKFGPGVLGLADICRAHAAIVEGQDFRKVLP